MSDTKQRTTRLGATSVAEAPPAAVFWRASAFSGLRGGDTCVSLYRVVSMYRCIALYHCIAI